MFERAKDFVLNYGAHAAFFSLLATSAYDFYHGNYYRASGELGIGLLMCASVGYKFSKLDEGLEKLNKISDEQDKRSSFLDERQESLDKISEYLDKRSLQLDERDELQEEDEETRTEN